MNGEDETARRAARASVRSSTERPLVGDAGFVEQSLQALAGWLAATPTPPAGALSFVRFDFNQEIRVADLGPDRHVGLVGPLSGGMHLSADPCGKVRVVRTGLMTAAAHEDALRDLELAPRAMVVFEPATRTVGIVCDGLPWPGAKLRLAQPPVDAWDMADLDRTMVDFHYDRVEGTKLIDLIMEGEKLRRDGRAKYHEALYLYLKYERGLDRRVGCEVRLAKAVVELRLRGGAREEVKVMGKLSGFPNPHEETAALGRRVASLTASRGGTGKPRLHLRCLCCDGSSPCAAAVDQTGFTMEHRHLQP